MTIAAGSLVTIAAPFNTAFPDTYPVIHVFGDGSAAVMTPGWQQIGATFDPTAQGANFASQYVVDTGQTINLSTLSIPTTQPPTPPPLAGFAVTSTSSPVINGSYPYDPNTQVAIQAVSLYVTVNNKFPAGQTSFPFKDVNGAVHLFPSVTVWQAFASAMADFVTALDLGQTPSQPVSLP